MDKNTPDERGQDRRYSSPADPLRELDILAVARPPGYADLWWHIAAVLHAGAQGEGVCSLALMPATHPPFDVDSLVAHTAGGQPFEIGDVLLPESERSRVAGGYIPGPIDPIAAGRAAEELLHEFVHGRSSGTRSPRDGWTAYRLHPWVFLFDPINSEVASRLSLPPGLSPADVARAAFAQDPSRFLGQRPRGRPAAFLAEVAPELAARAEMALRSSQARSAGTRAVALLYGDKDLWRANARIQRARHERVRRGVEPLLIPFEVVHDGALSGQASPERKEAFRQWSRSPALDACLEVVAGLPHGELVRLPPAEGPTWTRWPGGKEIELRIPERR